MISGARQPQCPLISCLRTLQRKNDSKTAFHCDVQLPLRRYLMKCSQKFAAVALCFNVSIGCACKGLICPLSGHRWSSGSRSATRDYLDIPDLRFSTFAGAASPCTRSVALAASQRVSRLRSFSCANFAVNRTDPSLRGERTSEERTDRTLAGGYATLPSDRSRGLAEKTQRCSIRPWRRGRHGARSRNPPSGIADHPRSLSSR